MGEVDSDEELDRHAQMEVDLAVAHELGKIREADKFRSQLQRKAKKKKETRRERVHAAWAGEMGAFNEAIERQAAEQHALKQQAEEGSDDDDDDDDSDQDQFQKLRSLQNTKNSFAGVDVDSMQALVDGPPK